MDKKEEYKRIRGKVEELSREMYGIANSQGDKSISAVAKLLSIVSANGVTLEGMGRVCYFAIKAANEDVAGIYYTPDEALKVVQEYVFANPPMTVRGIVKDGEVSDGKNVARDYESLDEVIDALSQYSIRELPHEHEEAVNGYVDRAVDAIGRERDMWKQKLNDAHEVGQGFLNALNDVLDKICYAKQKKEKDCPSTKDKEK